MTRSFDAVRQQFRNLHTGEGQGIFVLPNPWDVGSARILEHLGFVALATTSSGFAATLGRHDQQVTRDELVAHVMAITAAVEIPVNVDAERCYADDPAGVADTVERLADVGASGVSIEDYDPITGLIDPLPVAAARVAAAARSCHRHGIVLTGRAENHLYGINDLEDTIARLCAYRDAGADAVYAPGVVALTDIARLVREVAVPVNVLALPTAPSVTELASVGVRRVSTGGSLAWTAYGALVESARELQEHGTHTFLARALPRATRAAAFADAAR